MWDFIKYSHFQPSALHSAWRTIRLFLYNTKFESLRCKILPMSVHFGRIKEVVKCTKGPTLHCVTNLDCSHFAAHNHPNLASSCFARFWCPEDLRVQCLWLLLFSSSDCSMFRSSSGSWAFILNMYPNLRFPKRTQLNEKTVQITGWNAK